MDTCIKVASFNIKRDSRFQGPHSWRNRRELVAEIIRQSGLAIIGVQELLPTMPGRIWANCSGATAFSEKGANATAATNSRPFSSGTTIRSCSAARRSGFPSIPSARAARAYFAMFPRICTVCEVYVQEYGRSIRVFNTHFDHVCGPRPAPWVCGLSSNTCIG